MNKRGLYVFTLTKSKWVSVFGGGKEEIMVANRYLLSKYWGNFFVGLYLRIVLKTGQQNALVSGRERAFQHRHGLGKREQERDAKR